MSALRTTARAQGTFYVLSGLWPLASMRSFEAVVGPKEDTWLVRTVAGLLVTIGAAQLSPQSGSGLRVARLLGVGTSATLLAIDLTYVAKRRISAIYLVDAGLEAGLLAAWGWSSRRARASLEV